MFDVFLTVPYAPFAIAFVVMIGIGLIEAIGLGLGHIGLDTDAHDGGMLDWLGIGAGLPILIWLTSLLGCFTVAGIAAQQVATALAGAPLGPGLASGVALAIGGIANRFAATGLARIMPGEETSAITADDLVARRGTILDADAARGRPSRAKVVDRHGQAHYVMVEPHHDEDVLAAGEVVLLVRRTGALFHALPEYAPRLRSLP